MELQSALKNSRFQRLQLVGSGAAGDVYAADDVILSRRVAIKDYRDLPHTAVRIERALMLCAKLRHPGIAQVIDIIRTQSSLQMVQTYCENGSLAASLKKGSADEKRVADLFLKICDAVSYMHNRHILHCDLKLANILNGPQGEPVLIDFDLCCEIGSQEKRPLIGTPAYMAPELIQQSATPSVASEVYALGVILYELLSGQLISENASTSELLLQDDSLFKLNDSSLARRQDWSAILHKALNSDRTKRYESVAELARDVRNLIEFKPLLARKIGRLERLVRWGQRNRVTASLATMAAGILLVGVTASILAWGRAAAMRIRAQAGQIQLEARIGEIETAKAKLETLVTQVRAELESATLAETQQSQLTSQAKRAELDLQTAAASSAQLATELNTALRQASDSQQAVAELDQQRTTALSGLEAAKARLETAKVHNDSLAYRSSILVARKAQQERRWQDASVALEKTSPDRRGIEFGMLQAAIQNKLTEPEIVVIGRRESEDQELESRDWPLARFAFGSSVRYLEGQRTYFRSKGKRTTSIPVLELQDADATLLAIPWEANSSYKPIAITRTGDILLRKMIQRGVIEIGALTFAPAQYQANSDFISDLAWEHLMQQAVISTPAIIEPTPRIEPKPLFQPKSLLAVESVQSIQCCVWEGIDLPLQLLGSMQTIASPIPSHSIDLGTGCLGIAVSSNGLLASIDQRRWVSVVDVLNPNAKSALIDRGIRVGDLALDTKGNCYMAQAQRSPCTIYQAEVGRNEGGDITISPPRKIHSDPQGANGLSIPTWFDPNHLYLTNGTTISRYPLPLTADSQKREWFHVAAAEFWALSSCIVSDRQVLLTLGKTIASEIDETKSIDYATLLFDRDRQGFYVLDRIIETATKTPDGKSLLFVDDDGTLKRLAWEPPAEELSVAANSADKVRQTEQVSEPKKKSASWEKLVPDTNIAGYFRLKIIGRQVDVHSLKLSAEGLRSVKNHYAWPVFEVNGQRWEPKTQPLLSATESGELFPPNLNFSAAKIHCMSTGSYVHTQYAVATDSVEIAYIDPPKGAGDCCTIISIPYMSTVVEDMCDVGVTWNEPWATSMAPFVSDKTNVKWEPPTHEMISTMKPEANFQFEKLDFEFWNGPLIENSQNQAAVPKDYFVLTGQRSFKCPVGVYSVESFADDGIRVWLDDKLTIDDWKQGLARHQTQELRLAAGEHVVRFEYYEEANLSRLFVNVRRVE